MAPCAENRNINFDQLVKLKDNGKITLIDVRERDELKETGKIPGSYNVPLDEIPDALTKLNDQEFKNKYGFKKPSPQDSIVFSCKSGRRSSMALNEALKAGYNNSLNFSGGWLEWEENTKQN